MEKLIIVLVTCMCFACSSDDGGLNCEHPAPVYPNPLESFLPYEIGEQLVFQNETGMYDTVYFVELEKGLSFIPRNCGNIETVKGVFQTKWENEIKLVFDSFSPSSAPKLQVELYKSESLYLPVLYSIYPNGAMSYLERLDSHEFRGNLFTDIILLNCLDSAQCTFISSIGFVNGNGLAFYSNSDGDWIKAE